MFEAISINAVSNVLSEKSREGKALKIKKLLNKYNAGKLIEVKEEDYFKFIEEAKVL